MPLSAISARCPFTARAARAARAVAAAAAALLLSLPAPAPAQELVRPDLKTISPVFDGWLRNPDGSFTLFFGYFNRNSGETPIPIGPDNQVRPAPDDRGQPTNFLPLRQWHVFRVTVPPGWDDEVLWTLGVPGTGHRERTTGSLNAIYEIGDPGGPQAPTVGGVPAEPVTARVGQPLALAATASPADAERGELAVRWSKNRGPAAGRVTFSAPDALATTAAFSAPGAYELRLRVDEHVNMGGSSEEHHTDALVTVTVEP